MPDRKRYKVTGTAPVENHQPGETFTASFDEDREKFLRDIGAIRVVDSNPKKKRADGS